MTRCVILANGKMENYAWYRSLLLPDDIILCADGGALHARKLNIIPRGVIGDMDSIAPELLEEFASRGTEIRRYSPVKDEIDSLLALEWAFEYEPVEILLLGGIGSRLDHTIASIHLLLRGAKRGVKVRLLDEIQEVFLVTPELPALCSLEEGTLCSLLPHGEQASGITTENLKYILRSNVMEAGNPVGISNVVIGKPVKITVETGILIAFMLFQPVP